MYNKNRKYKKGISKKDGLERIAILNQRKEMLEEILVTIPNLKTTEICYFQFLKEYGSIEEALSSLKSDIKECED